MKQELIERLRQNEGKVVKINCSDGELLEAKIFHVDDEHRDVVFDFVASTKPEKYKEGTACAYIIPWDYIVDFQ